MTFRGGKSIWLVAAVVTVAGTGVAAGLTPGGASDATIRTDTAPAADTDTAERSDASELGNWVAEEIAGAPAGELTAATAEDDAAPEPDPAAEAAAAAAAAEAAAEAPAPIAPPTTEAPVAAAAPPPPPPPPPPPTTAPPPPPPPPPAAPTGGTRNTGCEQYMAQRINQARANIGRGALAFDTGIQHVAIDWSDEMARSQTLKHNPNYANQILRYRDYRSAGENVGRGYDQATLFQAFMDSPGHRANIESGSYSHVTVGCLTDGNGQLWVTQNFWG